MTKHKKGIWGAGTDRSRYLDSFNFYHQSKSPNKKYLSSPHSRSVLTTALMSPLPPTASILGHWLSLCISDNPRIFSVVTVHQSFAGRFSVDEFPK